MTHPRRILLLEDDPNDVELFGRRLLAEWRDLELVRVGTEAAFHQALTAGGFDLIISDYRLPDFHGLAALAIARDRCPGVPFLFLSGVLGDDVAVESLKAGATDYVLKDRPARLIPAIRRALSEAADAARRKEIEEQLRTSAEALRNSNHQYEELVNAVDGIVWQAEFPSLRFTFVSEQSDRLLGYPADRWISEPHFWQEHIYPGDRERAVKLCQEFNTGQKYQNFEYRMVAADGRVVWFRDVVTLQSNNGNSPRIQGIMVDITRRKLAEKARLESDALKSAITTAALDSIIVMDHEGKIIEFNPAAEQTFGYLRADIIGAPMAERLLPQSFREQHYRSLKHYLATGDDTALKQRIELNAVHANSSEFPVELAIIPIHLGERHVFTAYLRDITARKQAEQKVARIQGKLKQANKDLVRRNREIQTFYHTLSHELKTPLTSAREFISIVLDGIAGPITPTQSQYLGIAKDSCSQLRICINDLLDATRLETGKLALELKPASLTTLLQKSLLAISPSAAEKNITVIQNFSNNLPNLPLDEFRITQVIVNLLNNAIKFTPPFGRITIMAGDVPDRPELVQVSVSDTGCGIPQNEQEHIFDRLYQVKAGDATTEQGVGLGLYLCRELVHLHGGTISVESAPRQGSTFSFRIPRRHEYLQPNLLSHHTDTAQWQRNRLGLQTTPSN